MLTEQEAEDIVKNSDAVEENKEEVAEEREEEYQGVIQAWDDIVEADLEERYM